MKFEAIILVILFIHQTMDLVGVKGYVLRPELKSPDTYGWLLYATMLLLYFIGVPFMNVAFILVFGLVIYGLYFFHWKLFLFGATEQKIKGYNECFTGTHRIMAQSETKLVPDTYHMVHSCLYVIAFVTLLVNFIGDII